MFGDRYDFDGNGQNDLDDLFLEMELVDDEDGDDTDDIDADLDEEIDKKVSWGKIMATKNSISALQEKLEQCKDEIENKAQTLQDTYDERSLNEPDFLSSRYDAWQDKQSEYEERIETLEDIVSRLEDVISELEDLVFDCSGILSDCELYAADHKDLNSILPALRTLLS